MATVTHETPNLDGIDATYASASAGGDQFTPTKRTVLHVKNSDASSHDVTITTHKTVSVPAGEDRFIGPFDPTLFQDADGLADITWSATTGMTFAVLRI